MESATSIGSPASGMEFLVSSLECGLVRTKVLVVVLVMAFVSSAEVVVFLVVVLVGVGSGLVVEVGESEGSVGFEDGFDEGEEREKSFLKKEGAMIMLEEVRLWS